MMNKMADLINRDAFIIGLNERRAKAYLSKLYDCDTEAEKKQIDYEMYYSTQSLVEALMREPAVNAVPITHGHWIPHDEIIDGLHSYGSGYSQCSACKKVQWLAQVAEWSMNFCPSCGTKMDEKDGEHNEPNGNE